MSIRRPVLLAIAALFCAAASVFAMPAADAAPTHVAIVVSPGHSACVPWHKGMTGQDVLSAAFTVDYARDGFVLKINGVGVNSESDTQHYWAYFHNTGSGWRYSSSGAYAYDPPAGTVEGWAFDPQTGSPQPPANASYASICSGVDAASTRYAPPPTPSSTVVGRLPGVSISPPPPAPTTANVTHTQVAASGTAPTVRSTSVHTTPAPATSGILDPETVTFSPITSTSSPPSSGKTKNTGRSALVAIGAMLAIAAVVMLRTRRAP